VAPWTVPEGLATKGWQVERVEAYRTVRAPSPAPEVLARVARGDAVAFTAPSSVHAFLALRTAEGLPVPMPALVVCIGPSTAGAALEAGLAGVVQAHEPSAAGLVAALTEHVGRGGAS
jgi:uroporphyrinogen-III synthase